MRTDSGRAAGERGGDGVVASLVFASGFSALCLEIIYEKHLGYVFGTTAHAVSTVLAAFLAGLALGSFTGGRLARRIRRPVLTYGVAELAVGLYALGTTTVFHAIQAVVVWLGPSLMQEGDSAAPILMLARFSLACAAILPPTFLMGLSFPLLSQRISHRGRLGGRIGRLYTCNTLGAAAGALVSTYVVIARVGLSGAAWLCCAINLSVFIACLWIGDSPPEEHGLDSEAGVTPAASDLSPWLVYCLAAAGGFLTLGFEVVWTHVLALLVGTSTYAFGLVLSILLLALGLGGALSSRFIADRDPAAIGRALAFVLLLTCASILLTHPLWELSADVFELVGLWRPTFAAREIVRGLVVASVIFVPATLLGVIFPAVLAMTKAWPRSVGARVGVAYAMNAVGTIAGSVVTGFVLIERLGSEGTIRLLTAVVFGLAAVALSHAAGRLRRVAIAAAIVACGGQLAIGQRWDLSRMNAGSNVYFAPGFDRATHELVELREDTRGGFVAVVSDGRVKTLMTNGKFEGSDGPERQDQTLFAAIPNLFVRRFDRALNVGIGTAQSLAVIHAFGYRATDAADMSPNIVQMAAAQFAGLNHGVLGAPDVNVVYRDGRNHLLLNRQPYDLISIQLTSIWFASAGNLYTVEFYELCRANMPAAGILQQWVQLHHITVADIATIIHTLLRVFPYVELWVGGHQGILVASSEPLILDAARLEAAPAWVRSELREAGITDRESLLAHRLVPAERMAEVVDRLAARPIRLATDDNRLLEYSTPRGNALDDAYVRNLEALRHALAPGR